MTEGLITVIVSAYNAEQYIDNCIKSIFEQTHTKFQLIAVDDGSTDKTGEILDILAQKDRRLSVFHQPNKGVSCARNYGLEMVDGEFVTFVNAVDSIHPRYLEVLYSAAMNHRADLVIADYRATNAQKPFEPVSGVTKEINSQEALMMFYNRQRFRIVSACAKLYSTKLLEGTRFTEGVLSEDEFFTWKLLVKTDNIILAEDKLYDYIQNTLSITQQAEKSFQTDFILAFEQRLLYFRQHSMKLLVRKELMILIGSLRSLLDTLEELDLDERQKSEWFKELSTKLFFYWVQLYKCEGICLQISEFETMQLDSNLLEKVKTAQTPENFCLIALEHGIILNNEQAVATFEILSE